MTTTINTTKELNQIIEGPITNIKTTTKNNQTFNYGTILQKNFDGINNRFISFNVDSIDKQLFQKNMNMLNIGDTLKIKADITTEPAINKDTNELIKKKDGTVLLNINAKIHSFKIISRGIEMDENL